ncbi:DoxX family protein [Actinoplanes sp. NEAU-A12]|uniref:DoxX family protein n=1 Tax=Actinoplanes sandaracinus TaxID=3045177 RepID=A0ABT6WIA8_9ACTN|nr:DoxX family protein [Actinoplanes sandaracinus]MDI6099442.1 DoxX family protein [Actinoplanes sandaracinus]
MNNTMLRDLTLLVTRVALGVVFIAHGWQKFDEWGLDGTAAAFGQMGVPLPTASAWFAAIIELAGGVALIAGLAVPLVALLLAVDMIGALLIVHAGNGVFVSAGGFELVLTLAAAALLLGVSGAGRFSVDRLVAPRLPGNLTRRTTGARAAR